MPTIFLAVEHGFESRFLLRTGVLDHLRAAGLTVVILAPNVEEPYFQAEFGDRTILERFDLKAYRAFHGQRGPAFCTDLRWYAFPWTRKPNTVSRRARHRLAIKSTDSWKGALIKRAQRVMLWALARSRRLRKALIRYECKHYTPDTHAALFQKYKPEALVLCSTGFFWSHALLMREARRHGARVIGTILSWDNTSTKGMNGAEADHVVAWTETMKEELVRYLDIPPERIAVGGVPIYDAYFDTRRLHDQAWLQQTFGLDPARKTIFLTLMSPTSFPYNPDILRLLCDAIEDGRIEKPAQVLARYHPIYFARKDGALRFQKDMDALEALRDRYPFLHFDVPETLGTEMGFDMPATEMTKLGTSLRFSDVLICFFSSQMLEASIFDVPCISHALYTKENTPLEDVMGNDHVARVLATGGVRVAYTDEELVGWVNRYLNEPALDRAGRARIVETEAGPNRGAAARAFADQILAALPSKRSTPPRADEAPAAALGAVHAGCAPVGPAHAEPAPVGRGSPGSGQNEDPETKGVETRNDAPPATQPASTSAPKEPVA